MTSLFLSSDAFHVLVESTPQCEEMLFPPLTIQKCLSLWQSTPLLCKYPDPCIPGRWDFGLPLHKWECQSRLRGLIIPPELLWLGSKADHGVSEERMFLIDLGAWSHLRRGGLLQGERSTSSRQCCECLISTFVHLMTLLFKSSWRISCNDCLSLKRTSSFGCGWDSISSSYEAWRDIHTFDVFLPQYLATC